MSQQSYLITKQKINENSKNTQREKQKFKAKLPPNQMLKDKTGKNQY
jgi:hypothetical protein